LRKRDERWEELGRRRIMDRKWWGTMEGY